MMWLWNVFDKVELAGHSSSLILLGHFAKDLCFLQFCDYWNKRFIASSTKGEERLLGQLRPRR